MSHAHNAQKVAPALIVALTALALLLGPPAAYAGKPGKGPQASVSVATVCSLDGTDFTVDVNVRDKTSGDAIATVAAWAISARYQDRATKGRESFEFASDSQSGLLVDVPVTISRTYSLCGDTGILGALENARTLNAEAAVTYGALSADGNSVEKQRTVMNQCSDDPLTEDVVEPSGIKLTRADVAAIDTACAAAP